MKRSLSSVIVIIIFLFVSGAQAQRNNSTISGFVFDSQRKQVTQVYVELMNEFNSVIRRTKTDGSGRYFFSGLSGGRFSIRVLPLGTNLNEQTQEIEIVTFGGMGRDTAENVQKDFYLSQRRVDSGVIPITGTLFAQEIPDEAKVMYEKAVSNIKNEKIDSGINELENALKLFPDYYLALEKLGVTYTGQQQYEKARDIFSRAVKVNEKSFNCWYGLAYANYSLKQPEEAVENSEKAVSLNANSVEAQMLLGISLRQTKQYDKAEKSLLQAEKLADGKSADAYWNLALLYAHNLNRYKDAAKALELFLKIDPNIPNKDAIKKLIKQFREKSPSN